MNTRIAAIALVTMVALAGPMSAVVMAQSPGTPAAFHGDVENENGVAAPVGEEIIVALDGETQLDSTTIETEGTYAEKGDDEEYLEGYRKSDTVITFHVGSPGGEAAIDPETGQRLELDPNNLDLAQPQDLVFPEGSFDVDEQSSNVEGGTATVDFPAGSDVESVEVSGLPDTVNNVEIQQSDSSPEGSTPSTSVEKYLDITPQDSDGNDVSDSVSGDVVVKTTVAQSVINNLDNPALIHFTGGSWTELDTSVEGTTTLNATSSGLGSFAVGEESVSDDGDDDDDTSSSPGGGPGGPGEAAPGEGDEGAPTVQQVRDTLNLVVPSTDTNTDIVDDDPDTPGVSVTPEDTESVRNINFENEDVSGSVDIKEYSNPPQEVRESIAESAIAAGAVDTAGDGGGDGGDGTGGSGSATLNVVSVADITPDNEAAENSPATVTLSVPRSEVDNPERLTVIKETYDFEQQEDTWSELETNLDEVGDEEVTVSARAESFSLFAVAEVQPTEGEAQQQQQNQTADDGEAPTDEDGPGTGAIIGLLVILALIGAAAYLYSQQEQE